MKNKFKNELKGERITLKTTTPLIATAQIIFKTVDENRDYLEKWLPWAIETKQIEDSFKYLIEKEEKVKKGEQVDYGIYLNQEYIGNIGIFDIDEKNKSAEIGYWLSQKYSGKGYTTEAIKLLEKEFFENFDLHRIQIKCDERNIASKRVAEKCNFILEGNLREDTFCPFFKDFRNTLIFSKLITEFKKR